MADELRRKGERVQTQCIQEKIMKVSGEEQMKVRKMRLNADEVNCESSAPQEEEMAKINNNQSSRQMVRAW